jgi:hypothetical protein
MDMRAAHRLWLFSFVAISGCQGADKPPGAISEGIVIQTDGLAERQVAVAKAVTSAPAKLMKGPGLAGVAGGMHLRVLADKPQEVLLPIPQITDGQVPIALFVEATPADAVAEFRLRTRDDGNVMLGAKLAGKQQEVRLAWSAVVLLAPKIGPPDRTPAEPFRKPTACVQSAAEAVTKLAAATWPKSEKPAEFAANIQKHVREMKRTDRPRSLDAVGILKCGENGICTANANLAAALMRSKGIACRSVAVVPPIGQKLEMHRIVEYADDGKWLPFDPSGITTDIPAKPWQNIVMAKTTIADEEAAMRPRMAAMAGCPFGQEAELLTPGVTLFGQDFFWTQATPLAEFEVTADVAKRAADAWAEYLKTGTLTADQLKAAGAKSAAEVAAAFRVK